MTLNDYQKAAERTSAPTVARKWMEVLKMAEYIMTDCTRTLDLFAAWKRLCQAHHGACRGCPLFGDATGSIFTCLRFAFEQHAGSCLAGRKAWVQSHGIDMDRKTTVADFIRLCENDFGGDAIRALKERMETHD